MWEPGSQCPCLDPEHRVTPMRRNLEQGLQHEPPAVHLGVRQDEPGATPGPAGDGPSGRASPADTTSVNRNEIDVERSGGIDTAAPATCLPLNPLEQPEQTGRREGRPDRDDGIAEGGLTAAADRARLVEAGCGCQLDVIVLK